LNHATVNNYISMVQGHKQQIASLFEQFPGISHFTGHVGNLQSATTMATQFDDAIGKVQGLLTTYKKYADELETAVNGAFKTIIAEDDATSPVTKPK
jgi:hypothetical protein